MAEQEVALYAPEGYNTVIVKGKPYAVKNGTVIVPKSAEADLVKQGFKKNLLAPVEMVPLSGKTTTLYAPEGITTFTWSGTVYTAQTDRSAVVPVEAVMDLTGRGFKKVKL